LFCGKDLVIGVVPTFGRDTGTLTLTQTQAHTHTHIQIHTQTHHIHRQIETHTHTHTQAFGDPKRHDTYEHTYTDTSRD